MKIQVNEIGTEEKWGMAARGLTGALAAHLDALYEVTGKDGYSTIIRRIWGDIGRRSAEAVQASGMDTGDVEALARAGVTTCICAMGPEYEIEQAENSGERVVMKITQCPWQNRMQEAGIGHDLLSACDVAFWKNFTQTLNPDIRMRHGKQMHRGDPYCEWIFEKK